MSANPEKTCFVVMGFGTKTDYPNKRVLDLDKSYHNMIKPAVESAGLKCVRADEITHSGSIDEKMARKPEPEHASPVYQFIRGLRRPEVEEKTVAEALAMQPAPEEPADAGPSLGTLMQEANDLIANAEGTEDFLEAKRKLKK